MLVEGCWLGFKLGLLCQFKKQPLASTGTLNIQHFSLALDETQMKFFGILYKKSWEKTVSFPFKVAK